jgi:hypothetical protein
VIELDRLTAMLAELSGKSANRQLEGDLRGHMPVVHDCNNTVRVRLSQNVLTRLAPALRLMLASAQWLVGAVAQAHLDLLDRIHTGLGGGRQPRRTVPDGMVTVTEMHPRPDHLWLPHGAPDWHSTSEFRVAIVDRSAAGPVWPPAP